MPWRWAWQMNTRMNLKLHSSCLLVEWLVTISRTHSKLYFQRSRTLAAHVNKWAETLRMMTSRNEILTSTTLQVTQVERILQPTRRRCAWKPLRSITVIYWQKTRIRAARTKKANHIKIYLQAIMAAIYSHQSLFISHNKCNKKEGRVQSPPKWWSIRLATWVQVVARPANLMDRPWVPAL